MLLSKMSVAENVGITNLLVVLSLGATLGN